MRARIAVFGIVMLLGACGGGGGGGSSSRSTVNSPIGGAPGPGGNRAPIISNAPPTTASVGVAYIHTVVASDPDGNAVTLALAQAPSGATLDPVTNEIAWTPTVAQVGTQSFTLQASDGKLTTSQPFAVFVTQAPAPSPGTPAGNPVSSGGTSAARGLFTRSVTTVAQAGLPSITVPYKVLVPRSYDPTKPSALVVSELTPVDRWATIAEARNFIVAEQQGYQMNGAWTFNYDVLVLDRILDDVQRTWNVDVTRVHLTGFSAGAHWSYAVGFANASQFAGIGISAGAIDAAASRVGVWPNMVQRKIAVAIRHGTTDAVVPVGAARLDRDRLRAAGHPVDYAEFAGGHVVNTRELEQIWTFLEDKRRP